MPGDYTRCPFSIGMFIGTTLLVSHWTRQANKAAKSTSDSSESLPPCQIVFVLGGPGAGKGTQCQLLEKRLEGDGCGSWKHLSAGDLLRAERKSGGELGDLINEKIANGQLVPSSITVKLLENAMIAAYAASPKTTNFLIDGFPRGVENREAWEATMGRTHSLKFVLNFECPEEVLVGRLLERGQSSGRSDDTIEVIRKRFHTHQKECMPIVEAYTKSGVTVHQIASDKTVEEVYKSVRALF